MGFETRNGKGRYYTRSLWQDGEVVRQYVGGGLLGQLAAQMDAIEREKRAQEREAAREAEQAFEAEIAPLEQALEGLDMVCQAIMKGVLEHAGYHRPKKREWRKRRGT